MPISRGQTPRQLYGLGSLVKSIGKAVKGAVKSVGKVAKSPLGLAALTIGGAGLMGMGPLSRFATGPGLGLKNFLGKTFIGAADPVGIGRLGFDTSTLGKFLGTGLGKTAAIAAPAIIGGMFTAKEQEDIEALRQSGDRGLLQAYLRRYYSNLNPDAKPEVIEEFVRTNSAEGGRIGYQEGGIMPRLNQLGSGVSSAEQMLEGINQRLQSAESSLGGGGGASGFANIESAMQPNMARVPENAPLKRPFNQIPEQFKSGFAEYMKDKPMPLGGQAISYVGLPGGGGVTFGDTGSAGAFRGYLESMGFNPPSPLGQPLQSSLTATGGGMGSPLQQAMGFSNGGRIGYARGDTAEQNAIQASGIMDLPLNQNPAGITELDLRESGGFIPPVGVKEKADDIPAMLSNNEFVFTADAVRGMGDGNVNLGAQRMYDMMKKLENGGRV